MSEFQWPGSARVAVALTYDDAIREHYENVASALEATGLRCTFCLMARDLIAADFPHRREVSRDLLLHLPDGETARTLDAPGHRRGNDRRPRGDLDRAVSKDRAAYAGAAVAWARRQR